MKKIFLTVTVEGDVILGDLQEQELQEGDQIVYEMDIQTLVEIELDEGIHLDNKEDYSEEIDFYLQNAIREDYKYYNIPQILDTVILNDSAKTEIQEEVISRIKDQAPVRQIKMSLSEIGAIMTLLQKEEEWATTKYKKSFEPNSMELKHKEYYKARMLKMEKIYNRILQEA